MIPIRATVSDMPDLLRMGRDFCTAAWEMPFDRESAESYLATVVEGGAVFVDHERKAMIGGLVTPLFFNRSILVGTELFWWSESPGHGMPLLMAFERWAIGEGASLIAMTSVAGGLSARAEVIFTRRGYRLRENQWVRAA